MPDHDVRIHAPHSLSVAMSPPVQPFLTRAYYQVKPFVPQRIRWMLRRQRAGIIRRRHIRDWPILESARLPPDGWAGWPEGKRFAVVLTHDVESQTGVDRVRALAEVELRRGLRSSFNFIPEGSYRVPEDLRDWLTAHGFEVGVHDLNHDGKLYQSQAAFLRKAERINRYLAQWNTGGFRSGFMLRELNWLHALNIDYDCSTFDTDPFEPQPTGSHTIFPHWIAQPNGSGSGRSGYAELPYTLPQDSTLFLLLRERDTTIWKSKTTWIADNGGMVLLNVHPDYIDMDGGNTTMNYPLRHYEEFLDWILETFPGMAWLALPGQVSNMIKNRSSARSVPESQAPPGDSAPADTPIRIWIDLENTPHIPFFLPIIRELEQRGLTVRVTARDCYQTCELAEFHSMRYRGIGRHHGGNLAAKAAGLLARTLQLAGYARNERPDLALNLGSRSQNLAARLLRIPSVEIMDYEHTAESALWSPSWYLTPKAVDPAGIPGKPTARCLAYDGIKEDVYVPEFVPDSRILDELGIRAAQIVVTARPPATEAHYHNPEADPLFARFIDRALCHPGVVIVLLPRNARQKRQLQATHPGWFETARLVVPSHVIEGLNLIWHSDLVVSGGGTMNREAAALGVPVYSVFRGPSGAVDRLLASQRRLTVIESPEDVDRKILLEPRVKGELPTRGRSRALTDILAHLDSVIASDHRRRGQSIASAVSAGQIIQSQPSSAQTHGTA